MSGEPIGGEFPLDPLALAALPDRPEWPGVPGWEGATFTGSGRGAMLVGLQGSGARPGPIWVPEYACHSLLDSLRSAGFAPVAYPVRDDLEVDLDAWRAAWKDGIRACLVIHYFGFPQPRRVADFLAERGTFPVVEDRTHALLAPTGWAPDVAFASLRKWLALPDGGIVRTGSPHARFDLAPSDDAFVRTRLLALLARQELFASGRRDAVSEPYFLHLIEEAERRLDADTIPRTLSPIARRLLAAADFRDHVKRRRVNYERLAAALSGHPSVRPLHPVLADGVCPITFPIRCEDRDGLRARLKEARVYCPVHWPEDRWPSGWATPHALTLSRHLMSLPIDQRLSASDVDRMAALVWRHGP